MKRRDFLKRTAPAALLPFTIGGFGVKAYARTPLLDALAASAIDTDRVLVLVQLNGGNDGLNTVIPLDQYGSYNAARTNIAIAENQILKLTDATGIHPQMTGIKAMYDQQKVRVVQSVGYPNPDFSHFRSTDIWLTASDYDQYTNTGWLGRYLQEEFPGFPSGYPNAQMPDPLAIQIGSTISTALETDVANMGMAFSDPTSFYNIVNGTGNDPAPDSNAGHELDYIRQVGQQIQLFATPVRNAANKATNKSKLYPAARQNVLADQLAIVAKLIAGGLKTRIYIVNIGGFDTHANQNNGGNGTPVPHGTLLGQVSVAIQAFQDDLRLLGLEDRVVGMTFSEFGRRIKSNSSAGTDHGAAAPLIVFGTNVIPGILGANPIIPNNPTPNDNLPMQYDFRAVYASLLKDWFGAPDSELQKVLFRNFPILPIIKGTSSGAELQQGGSAAIAVGAAYPNPTRSTARIPFTSGGGHIELSIFDSEGRRVATLVDRTLLAGPHEATLDASDLPAGTYYCRLQSGGSSKMGQIVVVK